MKVTPTIKGSKLNITSFSINFNPFGFLLINNFLIDVQRQGRLNEEKYITKKTMF